MDSLEKQNLDDYITNLADSYRLSEEEMISIIKDTIKDEWERSYGYGYNISVHYNKSISISLSFDVVEEIKDNKTQIQGLNIGEKFIDNIAMDFSRSSMYNILQNIEKEIKYITRKREYETYVDEVGGLFTCTVRRQKGRSIYVEVSGIYEGIIPHNLSIQREIFQKGDKIKCRLAEAKFSMADTQLIFDRKSKDFIKVLLQDMIPEIASESIDIKAIERDPGSLCKIVVDGPESTNVIGACIGLNGRRRKAIMEELQNEKINFLEWSDDFDKRVQNFFGKKIIIYNINEIDHNSIEIVVDDECFSETIGRRGQNVFLISKLLEKKIIITKESEFRSKKQIENIKEIKEIENFGVDYEVALELLSKYGDWYNIIQGADIDNTLKNKIIDYYEHKLEKERQRFVELGGQEEFFMFNPNIAPSIYFYLLSVNIDSLTKLLDFNENAEKMSQDINLDVDLCVLLLQSAKELHK